MKSQTILFRALVALIFFSITTGVTAQDNTKNQGFTPHVGQADKEVIWVPTPDALVQKMLEIAKVTAKDVVVDLGSGDGRTVIAAAKLNAKATGIEYNPEMVELSKKNAEEAGVGEKTKFIKADLFEYDLSDATVITMFLLPDINLRLRPKLLELKPGTRIVSNTFTMGEWEPDIEVNIEENSSWNTALLWIVPAKLDGTWKMGDGELTLNQEFQKFFGTFKQNNKSSPVSEGKINGKTVTFKVGGASYTGQVNGTNSMAGTTTNKSSGSEWIATKE